MPASVPGLGKDPGINALTFEGEAGFSPIVYEGRKACPADETLLIVMITHSQHLNIGAGPSAAGMLQPLFHRLRIRPGSDNGYPAATA